jgi:hypothetical protein
MNFLDSVILISAVVTVLLTSLSFPGFMLVYADFQDPLDKGNIAEIFDFGSGIFAALLFILSVIAYRNTGMRRILFVSIAFALFAIRTIVSNLDLFMPEIESSLIELTLAIMGFAALALFFIAIVRKEKVATKAKYSWT